MKQQWQQLSDKFLKLSSREMLLIFISGLVLFFMVPFTLMVEGNLINTKENTRKIAKLTQSNKDLTQNINELTKALTLDPNQVIKEQIANLEQRLTKVDEQLLTLTEELINPIEMRQALIQLLKLQQGVSLLSFKVLPAEPLLFTAQKEPNSDINGVNSATAETEQFASGLYRHGIQIKLSGKYFQLRDYLQQLEDLPWKFFWHDFNYQLIEYPKSELNIEIYSLSTNQEFVGV
jgi:MSHA biogenesis protein MshJ